jgi:hypothetical protein
VRDAFGSSGCDLNAVDNYGDSALKKSVFSGNTEVTKTLLSAGADPDVCDCFMKSPLWVRSIPSLNFCNTLIMCFASEGCKVDCALALIASRADVNVRTSDGLTALHFAAQSGECLHR